VVRRGATVVGDSSERKRNSFLTGRLYLDKAVRESMAGPDSLCQTGDEGSLVSK
jgi:hypothetical protein